MIDPNYLRQNPEKVKNYINNGRGNPEKANIDLWLELDKKRGELIQKADDLRKQRNDLSKGITGKPDPETIEKVKNLKDEIEKFDSALREIETKWQEIMDWIPNVPLDDVPTGKTSDENVETKAWIAQSGYLNADKLGLGEASAPHMPKFGSNADTDFTPKPHWELGKQHDILDLETGANVSGSRFYYIKKEGALLVWAIFDLLSKKLIQDGFYPMIVPLLVKEKVLYGQSQFPGDADQVYKIDNQYVEDNNQLYLIGSSEPSNFGYFMDKTLQPNELPTKILAITPCFRSEAGSWGKDVRGMKRTHQFDKLEMNMIIEADLEKAVQTQEYLLSLNEWLLQQLQLPYHVINMCYGDLGYFAAAKKYDVEVWLPSEGKYMEVMSNSITTDYQSRRMNIKYRDTEGNSKYAYTLNDTGATHRLLIAIIEHYQQSDGSILVPEVLRAYVGKDKIG